MALRSLWSVGVQVSRINPVLPRVRGLTGGRWTKSTTSIEPRYCALGRCTKVQLSGCLGRIDSRRHGDPDLVNAPVSNHVGEWTSVGNLNYWITRPSRYWHWRSL